MVRVAYIGNFRAPFCTEVHIARDIEANGHTVARFQEPSDPHDEARQLRFLAKLDSYCQPGQVDLVLFTRTWGLPPAATALWRTLESRGIVTASYHLDLYRGLARQSGVKDDPFWTTQHVFTPDGDPESERWFARHGVNHHWSPAAVVSDACVPGNFTPELAYDVVFVGSYSYHREWPWRHRLIDWLAKRYGDRFRRFGGDTGYDLGALHVEGPIREQHLNDLYASARVVVGDSLCLPGHVNYWSDRPYETVGRGGFLLMPNVPGLDAHFENLNHLWFYEYGDLDALGSQIDASLESPEARAYCKRHGQRHVAENHTYRHRLAAAFDKMGLT